MAKDIKDYTPEELKAIAYDNLKQIQTLQANVQAVERELARRNGSPATADSVKTNRTKLAKQNSRPN